MHPDAQRLAAYLDGALGAVERADLRAHVLTCATCAVHAASRPGITVSGSTATEPRRSVRT